MPPTRHPRPARPAPRRDPQRSEGAASDTLGTILMIAITIIAGAGLAAVVGELPRPSRPVEVDLTVDIGAGASGWGSGDEVVQVRHRGGEALTDTQTTIVVRVGATTHRYTGSALGGPFADGRFSIGEEWSQTYTIQDDALVEVDVLLDGGETQQLAATASLDTPCSDDLAAPTVDTWTQTPSNVDAATTGAVQVTVALVDDCAGVDALLDPHLEYRLYDSQTAWTDLGTMTPLGGDQWQLSIADPTWANYELKTLEYKVTGMADDRGNMGSSAVRQDVINPLPTYFDSYVAQNGESVTNFANAQSAADAGAEATLSEKSSGSSPVPSDRYANSQVNSGVTNPGNAIGSPNDNYAEITGNNQWVRAGGFSQATGSITKVEMGFEGKTEGTRTDDSLKLRYRVVTTWGATEKTFVPTTAEQTRYVDVTADRTTWTWQNIVDTEIQAEWVKNASEDAIDFHVDALWMRITYTETVYNMSIVAKFVSVPAGASQELQLRYRVSGDSFRVQVWDGSAWNARGLDLTSTAAATWTYTLTGAEYNSGAPKIRFLDLGPNSATQGFLYLDYGRVTTS